MENWPAARLKRAKQQPIKCETLETTQDGTSIFSVLGASGERYIVEVHGDVELWPPRCSCKDNFWRLDCLCEHVVFCLLLMGVDERELEELYWEPSQEDMDMILMNAPDVVETCIDFGSLGAGLKMHMCHICVYAGEKPSYLARHMLTHWDERRHECGVCGLKFKTVSVLNTHRQLHDNQRHECSECGFV